MYIGINKFSASASDHKPLHVLRIQQEVAYSVSCQFLDTGSYNQLSNEQKWSKSEQKWSISKQTRLLARNVP